MISITFCVGDTAGRKHGKNARSNCQPRDARPERRHYWRGFATHAQMIVGSDIASVGLMFFGVYGHHSRPSCSALINGRRCKFPEDFNETANRTAVSYGQRRVTKTLAPTVLSFRCTWLRFITLP